MIEKKQLLNHEEKAVLVGVIGKDETETQVNEYLDELAFLAETAGAVTVKKFKQKLAHPDSRTYIGKGKLEEIKNYVQGKDIKIVIFDDELSGAQLDHFGVSLAPGQVPGVPKRFDMVSPDKCFVGDAKYFTLIRGERLPPAKFSVVSEYVWLLEKTSAPHMFLVFGNDRQVPELWLKRYGDLLSRVAFYFLTDDGVLHQLTEPDPSPARADTIFVLWAIPSYPFARSWAADRRCPSQVGGRGDEPGSGSAPVGPGPGCGPGPGGEWSRPT